jgi:AraC-like DNA-binding protein
MSRSPTSILDGLGTELHISEFGMNDLRLLFCGHELCAPGSYDGPGIRNHYVFHLILSGRGMFRSGGRSFSLSEKLGFMIFPETPVYYAADMEMPWEYLWVGFSGRSAAEMLRHTTISADVPVIAFDGFEQAGRLLWGIVDSAKEGGDASVMQSYGLFLELMAQLARENGMLPDGVIPSTSKPVYELHVDRAMEYIRDHLSSDISTSDVADYLGLNRSYFYQIFHDICGKSPSNFISDYRLNTAWHLLHYTSLPVGEIASQVGYNDPAYFTRRFTRRYGMPPNAVRNLVLGKEEGTAD